MTSMIRRPVRLDRRTGLALGLAMALAFGLTVPAAAQRTRGPDGLPDLVDQTIETVVNISTTARVRADRSVPVPQLPPGNGPLQEFFDEFFNRRNNDAPDAPRRNEPRRVSSLGSGFVIDPSGIIVTNNHVIDDADEITVIFHDGKHLVAKLVGRDPRVDIAVLKVESDAPLKAAKFGDSDRLRIGEWVMAIGNPLGFGGTVTAGILSARNRDINSGPYDSFLQTDAPINKGNSGGPLFNMDGEVIGINTAIVSPTGGSIGIGFAIPSNLAQPIIQQLRDFGETRRGWLGVRIQSVTDEIAESLGIGKARGAMIAGVTAEGPAAKAGLQIGDIVVKFNNRDITEMRDLPRIVAETSVGQTVPIVVLRSGKEVTQDVTVGRLEENEAPRPASLRPQTRPDTPPPLVQRPVMGMTLAGLTADLRRQYKLADDAKGVVVTRVDPGSPASEKGIQVGNLIVEVAQEAVSSPADVQKRIDALKEQGRRSALFLVGNAQGELRFVAVTIDTPQP